MRVALPTGEIYLPRTTLRKAIRALERLFRQMAALDPGADLVHSRIEEGKPLARAHMGKGERAGEFALSLQQTGSFGGFIGMEIRGTASETESGCRIRYATRLPWWSLALVSLWTVFLIAGAVLVLVVGVSSVGWASVIVPVAPIALTWGVWRARRNTERLVEEMIAWLREEMDARTTTLPTRETTPDDDR